MKYSDEEILGTYTSRAISPQFELVCQQAICENLVLLMETKGIYQNIQIPTSFSIQIIVGSPDEKVINNFNEIMASEFKSRPWIPVSRGKGSKGSFPSMRGSTQPLGVPTNEMNINFYLPEIETYCDKCKKNTIHLSMISSSYDGREDLFSNDNGICEQVFIPYYSCGTCRENVIVFLIRRKGNKLTLCGRSSRLKYEVDKIVPPKFRNIIEDSLSAVNENDVYAGFYHLRTFIEHYIKELLGLPLDEQKRGDELTKMYNDSLDKKLLGTFPSFSKLYDDLSFNIHSRKGESEDFYKFLEDIYNHLKAKELFNKYSKNA